MAENVSNQNQGFSNNPHFETSSRSTRMSDVNEMISGVGDTVSRYASSYDRSLRANPYLHIGLAGAGALALGYLFGRMTSSSTSSSVRGMSDIEAAYDE